MDTENLEAVQKGIQEATVLASQGRFFLASTQISLTLDDLEALRQDLEEWQNQLERNL